jgi:polyisoprenoid-binding protein YceI
MALTSGHYELGPQNGTLLLRTRRQGVAASIGHDLTIEVGRWSAEADVTDDPAGGRIRARVDIGSLTVREGTGGAMPLTADNRTEIERNARKALDADTFPEATFESSRVTGSPPHIVIEGTLTLHGAGASQRIEIDETGPDRYRARATVVQTQFGIKPYSAFLGALKLRDEVEVDVEVTLPEAGTAAGAGA